MDTGIAVTNGPGLVFLSGKSAQAGHRTDCLFAAWKQASTSLVPSMCRVNAVIRRSSFKVVCTKGKLKGKMLSFAKTMDWQSPVYVDLTEDTTESQCDNQPVNQPSTLHLFRPGSE